MKKKIFIILFWALSFPAMSSRAEEPADSVVLRPVMSSYTIEAGTAHLADTYISPIKYSGWHVGLRYTRMQAMKFSPERWVMQLSAGLMTDRTENIVGNATMWYWGADFSWAAMRRWRFTHGLSAGIGGNAMLDLGCLYSARNGNNPASAKAAVTVGATGYVAWNGRIGRLPVTLRYQPTLPVAGVFFSPDYGELYYEIYLGNHSGLVHPAWWGNYFKLDNLITADLHFGNTSLRIGYSGVIHTTCVNDITSRRFSHAAVIGVSGDWLSVNPSRRLPSKSSIISTRY